MKDIELYRQRHGEFYQKIIGIPLQRQLDDDQLEGDKDVTIVRGFFTSDNVDELDDVITRDATERVLVKYRQWGNVRYMHLPKPVGRITGIGILDGLEWNEVEIKVIDPQARFEVEKGLLTALSVGILIRWEDIEITEDGNWQINDYQLAEISLVDHPANYDAILTSVKGMFQQMAQMAGVDAALHAIDSLKEDALGELVEAEPVEGDAVQIEQDLEPVAELVGEHELVDDESTDEDPADVALDDALAVTQLEDEVVEEPVDDVEPVDADLSLEDTVEEVEEEELSDETDDSTEVVEDPVPDFDVFFSSLAEGMLALQQGFAELKAALEAVTEALNERIIGDGAPEADEVTRLDVERLTEENARLQQELDEQRLPVDRRGLLPEVALPSEEEPVDEVHEKPTAQERLRAALQKRLELTR